MQSTGIVVLHFGLGVQTVLILGQLQVSEHLLQLLQV